MVRVAIFCAHVVEWRPLAVGLTHGQMTAFNDELQPPVASEMCTKLMRHGALRDVLLLLGGTLQGNQSERQRSFTRRSSPQCFPPFFLRSVQLSFLQVASERTPLEQR